jgi:hypothetical protein
MDNRRSLQQCFCVAPHVGAKSKIVNDWEKAGEFSGEFVMRVILSMRTRSDTTRAKTPGKQLGRSTRLRLPHPSSTKAVPTAPCSTYRYIPADIIEFS